MFYANEILYYLEIPLSSLSRDDYKANVKVNVWKFSSSPNLLVRDSYVVVCHSHVLVCTCMSLVCTRMSLVCTRMSLVCTRVVF